MKTGHHIFFSDSRHMDAVETDSIDLIVTSPPYPMIEMWDEIFAKQDPKSIQDQDRFIHPDAFEKMHRILDEVWKDSFRVLKKGGLACINVGDAVRTMEGRFALFPNHSRIIASLQRVGFTPLPCILWRKQTNAPNKFMGSGMLPPGAYMTLEHEYILIARKGPIRRFEKEADGQRRRESAYFWEERNLWFSDVWMDLKGVSQDIIDGKTRRRSAAFPFELPYRLISMFSVKGDTVLDPFLGTGTTLLAAMAAARNSIGYEIERNTLSQFDLKTSGIKTVGNRRIQERLHHHIRFIENRLGQGKPLRHRNVHYGFPVVTRQETELMLNEILSVKKTGKSRFEVVYDEQAVLDTGDSAGDLIFEKENSNSASTDLKQTRSRSPKQRFPF